MMNGHPLVSIYPLSRPFPMTCLRSHRLTVRAQWLVRVPAGLTRSPTASKPTPGFMFPPRVLCSPIGSPGVGLLVSFADRALSPHCPASSALYVSTCSLLLSSLPLGRSSSLSPPQLPYICCSVSFPCFPGFPSMLLWAFLIGPSAPWRGTTSYTLIAC